MAVSRDGRQVNYISRDAWLPRGFGTHRPNHTGACLHVVCVQAKCACCLLPVANSASTCV